MSQLSHFNAHLATMLCCVLLCRMVSVTCNVTISFQFIVLTALCIALYLHTDKTCSQTVIMKSRVIKSLVSYNLC